MDNIDSGVNHIGDCSLGGIKVFVGLGLVFGYPCIDEFDSVVSCAYFFMVCFKEGIFVSVSKYWTVLASSIEFIFGSSYCVVVNVAWCLSDTMVKLFDW